MSNALQKLDFIVGLVDQISGPTGKIMKSMDTMTTRIQSGYKKIGYGAAGVFGAGYALDRLIAPAKELDRALGEVKSLDVADSVLQQLTKTSLKFSMAYGESAVDFVKSSYDIQSAINGLVGNELSKFTEASAILAKGTKADAATITSYVGTMYGIFKTNANAMGKGAWVEMLAGQTAAAVQMFKTTGAEMAGAFTSTGAAGVSHGIAMNEQIAILGTLQATMSGTEAGTKYKSFLAGVGKAQDELGLKFTDSQGKMLPMIQILERIKGKFGAIDTVAESDLLQKAFGRKEAVDLIKLLANDVTGLNNSITMVGKNKGMDKAVAMAEAIRDPFQVASAKITAIQTVLGKAILPALFPLLDVLGEGASKLMRWADLFPNVTRWVGIGIISIIGLIAGFSLLSIAVGISKFVMVGWGASLGLVKFALLPLAPLFAVVRMGWLMTVLQMKSGVGVMAAMRFGLISMWTQLKINIVSSKIYRTGLWLINAATVAAAWSSRILGGAFNFMKGALLAALPALWAFTVALLANPITWIVLGVVALVAAVVAAVVYWDEWTTAIVKFGGEFIAVVKSFDFVQGVIALWEKLPEWWSKFSSWLKTLSPFQVVGDGIDWLIEKINLIPGIEIGATVPSQIAAPDALSSNKPVAGDAGIINKISNATNSSSRSIDTLNVNNYGQPMNGQTLIDEMEFAAG